jgi:hypothetical protein
MIYSWRPEREAVPGASHQPDLSAEEALHALVCLSKLRQRYQPSNAVGYGLGKVFSFIVRLGRIPIRRHEDKLLGSIYGRVPFRHVPADYDSPYFKILVLLHAHFSRLPLSPELAADLAIVLERVFFIFSLCTHRDWSNSEASIADWRVEVFPLIHMCVHGMWDYDPGLKQIPHFEDDVSCFIKRQGLWLINASGSRTIRYRMHLGGA